MMIKDVELKIGERSQELKETTAILQTGPINATTYTYTFRTDEPLKPSDVPVALRMTVNQKTVVLRTSDQTT